MLVVVIGALSLVAGQGQAESQPVLTADAPMDMLVTAEWLSRHLHDPDLVVLDCTVKIEMTETGGMRAVNGRASYDAGHITSAPSIPVLGLMDDRSGRFKFMDELAALHPEDRSDRYVTYCGGGIAASGSAFVMVRLGFRNVAVYTASLQEWAADPANPMVDPTP